MTLHDAYTKKSKLYDELECGAFIYGLTHDR